VASEARRPQAGGAPCKPHCAFTYRIKTLVTRKTGLSDDRSGQSGPNQQKVGPVSALSVVVVIVVALLLATVLTAALRRDATRHVDHAPSDDPSFRSHAEASRGDRP
jgi:hypothetical protein